MAREPWRHVVKTKGFGRLLSHENSAAVVLEHQGSQYGYKY